MASSDDAQQRRILHPLRRCGFVARVDVRGDVRPGSSVGRSWVKLTGALPRHELTETAPGGWGCFSFDDSSQVMTGASRHDLAGPREKSSSAMVSWDRSRPRTPICRCFCERKNVRKICLTWCASPDPRWGCLAANPFKFEPRHDVRRSSRTSRRGELRIRQKSSNRQKERDALARVLVPSMR